MVWKLQGLARRRRFAPPSSFWIEKLALLYKIYSWQKYLYAIAVTFTPIPIYWSVRYIPMVHSGEFAQILSQPSYGNLTIPRVTILRWKLNVAGIQFLRVNVLNVIPPSRGCDYRPNNGVVNVVVGKMISKSKFDLRILIVFVDYSWRSLP